jgi:hypothetical protein
MDQLVDAAADRLGETQTATCRDLAARRPEAVVEIMRRGLGQAAYWEVLRETLQVRADPVSGRPWTPVQELICRCNFKGVVTTSFDPGIVNARMRVRPDAEATGFSTWEDELGLDYWRTGKVFEFTQLPVLYAHGHHNKPDSVVLATHDYYHAYEGKLGGVLADLMDGGHLVWIGFSDDQVVAIRREVAARSGTRAGRMSAAGHVAIMPWNPEEVGNDPGVLAQQAEISYGARLVLYPARGDDHSALEELLSVCTDSRFQAAPELTARSDSLPRTSEAAPFVADSQMPITWAHDIEILEHFTGRVEELARLDRWAADRRVRLVGVTAWGGAGKTALVVHWIQMGGALRRASVRGVFGWSFYTNPSADSWATALLEWAQREFGIEIPERPPAEALLALLRAVPLLLVLDGLEVVQGPPSGGTFGRLLNGTLQQVLTGACQLRHRGLVILTSRFPFADLEAFDGNAVRILEVPRLTTAEGSGLLAATGGDWLTDGERQKLVAGVDGHALAVGVLAGALADRPPASDLAALHAELTAAACTSARVSRVLQFYAKGLSDSDRYLIAAVSLFARPVSPENVLSVAEHEAFRGHLVGWTPARVMAEVRDQLAGLVSLTPDGNLSAHPLVRDTFRPLAQGAAQIAANTVLADLPGGQVATQADALRLAEVIEMLLEAGQWQVANSLYIGRSKDGQAWTTLPAPRPGLRSAGAFVATPELRDRCATFLSEYTKSFYMGSVGLDAILAGDLNTALEYLSLVVSDRRDAHDSANLMTDLSILVACLGYLGELDMAQDRAAETLNLAKNHGTKWDIRNSRVLLGWLAGLKGEAAYAEEHFSVADKIEFTDTDVVNPIVHRFVMTKSLIRGTHLNGMSGTLWADWLARTGRPKSALKLTKHNREESERRGWRADIARCDRTLGQLALADGDLMTAGERLSAAARCFRDADLATELASTIVDLAEHARVSGDLETAEQHATEAITLAVPRNLILAQLSGRAVLARIWADRAIATKNADPLGQGRDSADAALRLARRHHLMWGQLEALRVHAVLDEAEGTDHQWAAQAASLHSRLVPPGLDPDPLATVERPWLQRFEP